MPQLAPIIAAASAALTGIGSGAGILGSFLTFLKGGSILAGIVKLGFGMAAQYALGALFAPKPSARASQLEVSYGDDMPRTVVLGRVGIAGQHVFRNARGSGNRRIDDVYKLSDFRISDIARAKGDGHWRALSGDSGTMPATEGPITYRKYYGTMDQTADAGLVSTSGGRWTADAVGAGIAYAVISTKLDIEKRTTPWEPLFEVIGPNLYDWRNDDTVGGDGDDRWNDPSTWTGDPENPVLQMYLLERGVFNGAELIVGKGISSSRLPLAEWTVAANICDELVNGITTRYRSSVIAAAGSGITHDANMQPLLEACAASWIEDASGEYPIVGAPQAVVATFTDDDLIVGESYRFSKYRPRAELVNTVSASYVDPTIFYEDAPIATRIDDGALAVDGERLAVMLPFKAVTYSEQADRLADIQTRASRYQASADICLRPKFLALKPGRWVTWNSARHGERTFLIVSKRLGAIGSKSVRNVYLSLQEIADGVFDPTEYETVPTSPLPPGTPDYASEVDNIVVQGWLLTSGSEDAPQEIPAIRVAFDEILDESIVAVDFEYWPTDQPTEINYDTLPMPATVKFLTVGVISNTEYQVRYKLRADPPRTIPWVGPYAVTTPEAAATDITVKLANFSTEVKQTLQGMMAQTALQGAQMEQLALNGAEVAGSVSSQSAVSRKFRDAMAIALTGQKATIDDTGAALKAFAEAVTAVKVQIGPTGAEGLFRITAEATPGDAQARIGMSVSATAEGLTKNASLWIDALASGDSRIVLAAAQTAIADEEGNVLALFDEDGVHIANARIANLTGDQISFNTLTGDHIVALSIDSPSLAFEAVTEYGDLTYDFTHEWDGGESDVFPLEKVADITIDNPSGNPLIIFVNLTGRMFGTSGSGTAALHMRLVTDDYTGGDSNDPRLIAFVQRNSFSNGSVSNTQTIFRNNGETELNFQIYRTCQASTGGSSGINIELTSSSGVLWWKR